MSADVFGGGGLDVTRLCGPAALGDDRRLWQFTIIENDGTSSYVQLRIADVTTLVHALARDVLKSAQAARHQAEAAR